MTTKNLPHDVCKDIAGYSGFYDSFMYAYCSVHQYCADRQYYLDDRTLLYKLNLLGCTDAKGYVYFCFNNRSINDYRSRVSFEWFTTTSGKISITVRVI